MRRIRQLCVHKGIFDTGIFLRAACTRFMCTTLTGYPFLMIALDHMISLVLIKHSNSKTGRWSSLPIALQSDMPCSLPAFNSSVVVVVRWGGGVAKGAEVARSNMGTLIGSCYGAHAFMDAQQASQGLWISLNLSHFPLPSARCATPPQPQLCRCTRALCLPPLTTCPRTLFSSIATNIQLLEAYLYSVMAMDINPTTTPLFRKAFLMKKFQYVVNVYILLQVCHWGNWVIGGGWRVPDGGWRAAQTGVGHSPTARLALTDSSNFSVCQNPPPPPDV